MKKLICFILISSVFLCFSGCELLFNACFGGGESSSSSEVVNKTETGECEYAIVNEKLTEISLKQLFSDLGKFKYKINEYRGFCEFYMTYSSGSKLAVTIVPSEKKSDRAFSINGKQQQINGLTAVTATSVKRLEDDMYSFKCLAVIGETDKAFIVYEYISESAECEFNLLLGELFERMV